MAKKSAGARAKRSIAKARRKERQIKTGRFRPGRRDLTIVAVSVLNARAESKRRAAQKGARAYNRRRDGRPSASNSGADDYF